MFLTKGVLKVCSKFAGEHLCRSAISIKLQSNFIEITLRHGCSPVNLQHIFRTPFVKNTSGRLLLRYQKIVHSYNNLLHLNEKQSFTFKISLVNVSKSTVTSGFA